MYIIQPREIKEVTELILSHKNSEICLVDDIDCDGLSSLIIMYRLLERMEYDVSIHYNTKHGIHESELEGFSEYDLMIILDSSSNECDRYESFKGDILVIDHHEMKSGLRPSGNTLLCNSKNTPCLGNISAGFLTYTICKNIGDITGVDTSDLFPYGIMSIYSDIVPVDEYIKSIIDHNIQTEFITDLGNFSKYNNRLTKTAYQMDIVPKFNYTRRLGDLVTIDKIVALGYRDNIHSKLVENRLKAKEIVNLLSMTKKPASIYRDGQEALRYLDITESKDTLCNIPLTNFKGLLCNREKGIYSLNTVVCGIDNGEGSVAVSIRSDADALPVAERFFTSGGGHNKACGGIVQKTQLSNLLKAISELNPTIKDEVIDMNWSELDKESLMQYAVYNEYAYSNINPYQIRLPYNNLMEMPSIEHSVGGIKIKKFNRVPIDKPITLTPTLVGSHNGDLDVVLIVKGF